MRDGQIVGLKKISLRSPVRVMITGTVCTVQYQTSLPVTVLYQTIRLNPARSRYFKVSKYQRSQPIFTAGEFLRFNSFIYITPVLTKLFIRMQRGYQFFVFVYLFTFCFSFEESDYVNIDVFWAFGQISRSSKQRPSHPCPVK